MRSVVAILAFLTVGPLTVPALAQLLAFPEAEGFGRFAAGARTNLSAASVYHVTNLNDAGPGSFRDAVSQSNRFVVFDVGGIATINSVVEVSSNITIAGQTAPGGFVVYGDRLVFHGADNLISRHWAVRKGRTSDKNDDAASIVRGNDMIFDHMSITWGTDGTFDMNHDSGQTIDNITVQDSIIAQGLDHVGHSTGGLIQPGEGGSTSFIRNLWADNVTRNPKVRRENEFINNVVYDYLEAGYIMGDTVNAESYANVEGNYFIKGSSAFTRGSSHFHIYANDNWIDNNDDGVLNGTLNTSYPANDPNDPTDVVATRHSFPTTTTITAQEAVDYVARNAGLSIIRDAVDTRLMDEVLSYGTLGNIIIEEDDLFPGYGSDPVYLNPRARFVDNDNDGIADHWEATHGLNPANANDWKGLNAAGYTRLEEYVNELGSAGTTVTSTGGVWTTPATWPGGLPILADDAVATGNLSVNGGHAFARRLDLSGSLEVNGGTVDVFDTATITGTSTISSGTVTAGQLLLGSPGQSVSLTVQPGATLRSSTIANHGGTPSVVFNGGTFQAGGAPNVQVDMTLGAGGGTVDTAGFDGKISGAIAGSGGLTKQGEGLLRFDGPITFTGPLVVERGGVELGPAASVSSASTIDLAAGTKLDASAIAGGMVLASGQTLTGKGRVTGNLNAAAGSVILPFGELTGTVHTIGLQAESLPLTSDWAVFDNAVHGTGNGGSYNGNGLFGDGIVMVTSESLSAPASSSLISTTVDIPQAGTWYLFARIAEPSVSVIPGDPSTAAGGNNSLWVSGNSATLQTTTSNFEEVQSPDSAPDAAKWVKLSPTLPALSGVWTALNDGIDYNLTAGQQTFTIGGREVGTILDGFVLSTANLDTFQLDAALLGSTGFNLGDTLTVDGNYTQSSGATLAIEIGSADSYNKLTVTGAATLGGLLEVSLVNLGGGVYQPRAGDSFEILSAGGGLAGTFNDGITWPALDGFLQWDINYEYGTDRVLLNVSTPFSADFDGDGDVDHEDLSILESSYGVDGLADTDNDGDSDGLDFLTWQQQFTGSLNLVSAAAAVPEPTTLALALLAGTLLARLRPNRDSSCHELKSIAAARKVADRWS